MDLEIALEQLKVLRASLELLLLQGQFKDVAAAYLYGVVLDLEGQLRQADAQCRASSLENVWQRDHDAQVIAQKNRPIAELEAKTPDFRYPIVERERAAWEKRCGQAESRVAVLEAENRELRDKYWRATGEGFPEDLSPVDVYDTASCPQCGGVNLVHESNDNYRCLYCGETFHMAMPSPLADEAAF